MAALSGRMRKDLGEAPKRLSESRPSAGMRADVHHHRTPLNSADLLAGRREVVIDHDGELYRLRHTKNGKLILNK